LLSPEGSDVQGQQKIWVLLHVVVHLLLLVRRLLIILQFFLLVFLQISFTLFIDLIIIFEHEILFISIMLVELCLFFRSQLLS
tara:strand:- start:628 stop:876 length:249 start_codon:yes stop_codon:yes gene_type:complete